VVAVFIADDVDEAETTRMKSSSCCCSSVQFPPHPRNPRQGSSDPNCCSLRPRRFSGGSLR